MEAILTRLGYSQSVIDNFKREGVTPEAATLMNAGQFQQLGIEGCGRQAVLTSRCRAYLLSMQEGAGSSSANANRLAVTDLFQPYSQRKKKRKSSSIKLEFVCLSSPGSKTIPKDFTKKILQSAGLGLKIVWVDSIMSAGELRKQLFNEFPKLVNAGGFEYMRTTGHKKELEVIPLPPGGGYSATNIKAIVSQAKVYLRPIQCELDITGEAEDGSVADDTLQECFICGEDIPETKLKGHRTSCLGIRLYSPFSNCRDERELASSSSTMTGQPLTTTAATPPTHISVHATSGGADDPTCLSPTAMAPQRQSGAVSCSGGADDPTCLSPTAMAPQRQSGAVSCRGDIRAYLEGSTPTAPTPQRHSAPASDRYVTDYINLLEPVDVSDDDEELKHVIEVSLTDIDTSDDTILKARMQEKLNVLQSLREDDKIQIVVRRKKILKSAADAINKQIGFSFYGNPVITFSGEYAVDLGGPKREFFTMATQQLPQLGIFEGKQKRMYFSHEIGLLEKGLYRLAGQIIGWSILHGGPGFPVLHPWLYTMMCGTISTDGFSIDDITDPDVLDYLQKIENCSSDEQLAATADLLGDWAASNGCTSIYGMKMDNKDEIVKTLFKQHIYYRCKSEIDEFQQGLNNIGELWAMMKEDPAPFRCLLVWSEDALMFSDMKKLFHVRWSDNSALVDQEEDTVYCWEQFIRKSSNGECCQSIKLEDGTTDVIKIVLHHILRFCTGADGIPPLGFDKQIDIEFFSITPGIKPLPTASTCGLELHLPRGMDDANVFAGMMMEAIVCSPGFGKS